MKNLIVLSAMVIGFSAFAADNHGKTEHKSTTTTTKTETTAPAGTTVALSEKEAKAACSKEGKKGADLTTCVKEKQATHQ